MNRPGRGIRLRCVLLWTGVLCLCLGFPLRGQNRQTLRFMEYNVENLFDTIPSTDHKDADFTPQGTMQWTSPRYWAKLSRVSRVIASCGHEGIPPALVALVEVENDSVVSHLVHRTRLARWHYDCCITRSADVRGINVALLYQARWFRPLATHSLRVSPPSADLRPTRDVLHVTGLLPTMDTLDIMVCHWPSRKGGREAARYRDKVASSLRAYADSVMHMRLHPMLVITGDFNSYADEPVVCRSLGAVPWADEPPPEASSLFLMSASLRAGHGIRGTYKFRGEWNQLDHFVVNGSWLTAGSGHWTTHPSLCRIVDFPFLLEGMDSEGGPRPYRTYLGTYYHGGFSDHLPLVLDLVGADAP